MDKSDWRHLGIGFALTALGVLSVVCNFYLCISILLIILFCSYVVLLLVECAHRSKKASELTEGQKASDIKPLIFELPNRSWAILLVFFLVTSNVSIFANVYLCSDGIFYEENTAENRLQNKWDAIYFSAVTVTTLGYGDFLPNQSSRKYVVLQLNTGLLLLLFIIPVVAGRLSTW